MPTITAVPARWLTAIPTFDSGLIAAAINPSSLIGTPLSKNGTELTVLSSKLYVARPPLFGSVINALCVWLSSPTPWAVCDNDKSPITTGDLPTSPDEGSRPRSTIFTEPEPPGVTIAQFNCGSIATDGTGPVP